LSTPSNRLILEYGDQAASWLRSSNWRVTTGTPAPLVAAIQAATNANVKFATEAQPIVGTVTPGTGLYSSVQDVLLVTLATVPGVQFQFTLPAPLGSMFLSGGIVVDPANATWIALLAAITANLTDIAGNTVSGLISAVKTSRRNDQVS
jgi:hypothetical protein